LFKKLKFDGFNREILCWVAPLILAIWAALYLYFVSSSQIPSSLTNYDEELHVKEHVLRHGLTKIASLKLDIAELANIYKLITLNEICLNDFPAAEKHLSEMIKLTTQPASNVNDAQSLALFSLQNANLSRDLAKYDLAKANYERSMQYLSQISPLSPAFNETVIKTAAVNLNNQGVLSFLIGQKTIDSGERLKVYLNARNYFNRAKHLILAIDPNKNLCFQQNVNENLNRCLAEMEFSN
jgi:tetratricopeptide (TPR) repeat protein